MLNFFAVILCIVAYFSWFKINPIGISQNIINVVLEEKSLSIKDRVRLMKGKKNENFLIKYIKEVHTILKKTNKVKQLPIISFLALAGAFLSSLLAISLNNYYLAPVVFIIFLLMPFIYVKNVSNLYKKELDEELETTMSVITSSYERNNNIISAVSENLEYINHPAHSSFEKFLIDVKINPDIKKALENLREDFTNPIFKEWIDNLILCQDDSSIKLVLPTIVKKMNSVRIINSEIQVLLSESKLMFSILTICAMLTPFGIAILPSDFIGDFFGTTSGKIAVSVIVAISFITYIWVLKIIEPMEE